MKYFVFWALQFILLPYYYCQNGTIKGKLMGYSTNESIPFAVVTLLTDSGKQNNGAVSNINGEYLINNIKPGSYTLKVGYIGYREVGTRVIVKADSTIIINLKLKQQGCDTVIYPFKGKLIGNLVWYKEDGLVLRVKTEQIFSNGGYSILYEKTHTGNKIEIQLKSVADFGGMASMAFSPAHAFIVIGDLGDGDYELNFKLGKHENKAVVKVNKEDVILKGFSNKNLSIENTSLIRLSSALLKDSIIPIYGKIDVNVLADYWNGIVTQNKYLCDRLKINYTSKSKRKKVVITFENIDKKLCTIGYYRSGPARAEIDFKRIREGVSLIKFVSGRSKSFAIVRVVKRDKEQYQLHKTRVIGINGKKIKVKSGKSLRKQIYD